MRFSASGNDRHSSPTSKNVALTPFSLRMSRIGPLYLLGPSFHIHLVGTQGLTVITHIQGIRFGALPDINATTVGGKLHLRTGIVRMDILLAHHSSRTVL